MSTTDHPGSDPALAGRPGVDRTWQLLRERHGDRALTLATRPGADLDFDSMDWIELATAIGDRAGVRVDDHAIARVDTLGDLLAEVARSEQAGGAPVAPLDRPEDLLHQTQREYLDPLPATLSPAARGMFALNRALFRRMFNLQVRGLDRLPARPPFVIAPNHISYLDGLVVAAALPYRRLHTLRWVAYAGQSLANPVTRLVSRLALILPIDAEHAPLAGLAGGAAVLAREQTLIWFPAGQRSPDGRVQDFQPGIGVLLSHFRVPVVPAVIDGSRRAMPPGQSLPNRRDITVRFGTALDPTELARSGHGAREPERITHALHDRVAQLRREAASPS